MTEVSSMSTNLFRAINVVLGVMVILLVGLSLTRVLSKPVAIVPLKTVKPIYDQPLKLHWFNHSSATQTRKKDQGVLHELKINGELLGVMVAADHSTATLKLAGGDEQVYRVGDNLGSGVRINAIEHFRIVVESDGVLKAIYLSGRDTSFEHDIQKEPYEIGQIIADTAADNLDDGASDRGFSLANMFAVAPVKVGAHIGLKLNHLSDDLRILTSVEEDDVVLRLESNGQEVDVEQLMANPTSWSRLATQTNVPVTVLRDGEEVLLHVNVASLSARVLPRLGGIPQ